MTPLEWGLVALVVIPLAQIPVVVYLSRYVEREEDRVPPGTVPAYGMTPYPGTALGANARTPDPCGDGEGRVACGSCGTCNDAAYDFCRACVGRLPA